MVNSMQVSVWILQLQAMLSHQQLWWMSAILDIPVSSTTIFKACQSTTRITSSRRSSRSIHPHQQDRSQHSRRHRQLQKLAKLKRREVKSTTLLSSLRPQCLQSVVSQDPTNLRSNLKCQPQRPQTVSNCAIIRRRNSLSKLMRKVQLIMTLLIQSQLSN